MIYETVAFILIAIIAFIAGMMWRSGTDQSSQSNEEDVIISKELKVPDIPNFIDDRDKQSTGSPSTNFTGDFNHMALPTQQRRPSGCMVGCSPCSPLCSGEGNPCMITAPVPGPTWQPQSASTVQYRLRTGNYVPSYCPQGVIVQQSAPECSGLYNLNDDREPKQVTCYTAKHPLGSTDY